MPTWADYTLPHSELTGKSLTDPVTEDPKTGVPYADPIPFATPLLEEAKDAVQTRLNAVSAPYILLSDTVTAFYDMLIAHEVLAKYAINCIAWAWLMSWYEAKFTEEGDRFWVRMNRAEKMLDKAIESLSNFFPQVLGDTDRDLKSPRVVGRVVGLDAHGI